MPDLTIVVIAGGSSSRFYPLNSYLHKGGSSLLGIPIFERTLKNLEETGYKNVIAVLPTDETLSSQLGQIAEKHRDQLDIKLINQPEATGMGDAVLLAAPHINTQQFLVITPYHTEAGAFSQRLLELNNPAAIFTTATDTPWRYGIVSINNSLATGITEKPAKGTELSNQKVQAIYLLNQKFLEILEATKSEPYSFEVALNQLMQQSKVGVVQLEKSLPTLKFAWHLFDFLEMFLKEAKTQISTSAKIAPTAVIDDSGGAVIIGENTKIGHCAKIVGPCYIGPDSLVGDFSLVRNSNINHHVIVGANTEVVRSIIFENSSIHFGYLADSILGRNNKIAAGLITANKRFDREKIKTKIKGKMVDTGRNGLGIITGDNVSTGIGVNFMPGVLVGSKQVIFPGKTVQKNIPE